jgi:hypothetical protein
VALGEQAPVNRPGGSDERAPIRTSKPTWETGSRGPAAGSHGMGAGMKEHDDSG